MFVMENTLQDTSRWRLALRDKDHPLYEAAWLIFSNFSQVKTVGEYLTARQEEILPFLFELIEDDYLGEKGAPGQGYVRDRAVRLLGVWQRRDTLPQLLEELTEADTGDYIYDAIIDTIIEFGAEVIPHLLTWVQENDEFRVEIAEILEKIGEDNTEAFNAVLSWIEPQASPEDIEGYVKTLASLDEAQAKTAIENLSKDNNFAADTQKFLKHWLKDSRKTKKKAKKA